MEALGKVLFLKAPLLSCHSGLDLFYRGKMSSFENSLQSGEEPEVGWCEIWGVRRMVMSCDLFVGQELSHTGHGARRCIVMLEQP